MKAIRVHQFGGPEVLKLEEVPEPAPAPNQILIKLRAIGVNPVDTYFRSGTNPAIKLPYTPGLDGAGEIAAVGAQVTSWKPGDRVYCRNSTSGTYAEFCLSEADAVYALPENLSFEQGAGISVPYGTAYRALIDRAKAEPGEFLLIHGASGGVGTAAAQIARAHGMKVAGTAGSEEGLALARREGCEFVANHRHESYLEELMRFTNGRGFDVVLEMLANVNLGKVLPCLAPEGRVIVVGSRGTVEILPRDLMSRDADVRGMYLFNVSSQRLSAIHRALYEGFKGGWLRPIVGKSFSLAEAAKAHVAVLEPAAHGKIVLQP
jgi:NADPH2:quinone reductase